MAVLRQPAGRLLGVLAQIMDGAGLALTHQAAN